MKTIVIVEHQAVELESLVNLFQQWQKEINVISTSEEQAAINIMAKQRVDLVVCDIAVPGGKNLDDFSLLTNSFPYVPCIALTEPEGNRQQEVLERGASHC